MKRAAIYTLAFLAPFLLGMFIKWDMNPANWTESTRGVVVMLGALLVWTTLFADSQGMLDREDV